ncbi:MAG TPA: outer membrane lipoprotein-sorting protein [Verrucomicrobiae bacterium]|jgi:hypothetical protein
MIPLLLLPLLALTAVAAQPPVSTAPPIADPIGEGQKLRAELLAQQPAENSNVPAVLKIRSDDGERAEVPVRLRTELLDDRTWRAIYEATPAGANGGTILNVTRRANGPNEYTLSTKGGHDATPLDHAAIFQPFAGSDFSPADLGLEFLHWPEQRVLKHEMRRGRPCKVLESGNPSPAGDAYVRVLSWIDSETGGLLRAEAYDARRKLMKEFSIRSFKKVEGRWQLREMEIINYPSDSRTRLEFDLTVDTGKTPPP